MSKKAKPPATMTSEEKGAMRLIEKQDRRIVDENTIVRLEKTTRNADGSIIRNYVVADNGKIKWKAKTVEKRGKQRLKKIASVEVVERLPQQSQPAPVAKKKSTKPVVVID